LIGMVRGGGLSIKRASPSMKLLTKQTIEFNCRRRSM